MKKIEIARELVNAINENNKLSGNHIYTKEEMQQLVAKTADRNSKENLETLLDEECERNARLVKAQERERKTYNFEHSEEGLKAADELHSAIKNWTNDIKDEIHTIVEAVLGSKWEAYSITSTGFEVGLLGEDGNPVWGYSFPVRFGYDLRDTKDGWEEYFKFQANVCSMGEFEIDGNAKQEFYIGFGQFLASEKVNGELKNELKLFTDNIREARKAYKEKKEAYINK